MCIVCTVHGAVSWDRVDIGLRERVQRVKGDVLYKGWVLALNSGYNFVYNPHLTQSWRPPRPKGEKGGTVHRAKVKFRKFVVRV